MKNGIYGLLLFLVFMLSSCSLFGYNSDLVNKEYNFDEFFPLEDVKIDDFESYYEGQDFEVLKRKDSAVDNDLMFAMYAIILENDSTDDYCTIGAQHEYMYIIKYNESIYDLSDAYYIGFYDCNKLFELAIIKPRITG